MKDITFFPGINPKKAKEIFSISKPEFIYLKDGIEMPLTLDDEDSKISSISDKNGFWNPDEYGLILKWNIKCIEGDRLYGADNFDDMPCACENAVIGIALSWYSQDTKRRNSFYVGKIKNEKNEQSFECKCFFDKSELRGKVGFSLILYIKDPGNPNEDELHFANVEGYELGHLDDFSIMIDGNGSYFTISEIKMPPGEPLWKVEYDIDDPSNDNFSDCVSILLNNAHPQYKYIKRGDSHFNLQLLIEIMANSMATVIEMVRCNDKEFECMNNPEEGSVGQALLYFKNVLEWDFTSPITVSNSIRKYLEKNISEV